MRGPDDRVLLPSQMPRQLRLLALLAAVHVCTPFCAPPARARSSPPRRAAVEDDDPELAPPSLSAADRELFDRALQLSGSAPSDEGPSFWSEDELADEAAGDDDAARGATADGAGGDAAAAAGAAFGDLALSPRLAAALRDAGFARPTTIQARATRALARGKDAVVHSPTGTGKTLAFLVPALAKLESELVGPDKTEHRNSVVRSTAQALRSDPAQS